VHLAGQYGSGIFLVLNIPYLMYRLTTYRENVTVYPDERRLLGT